MNPNLLEAAREEDISKLEILLNEDRFMIERSCYNESAETILHTAVFGGHAEFVKRVINKNPDLATRLNQDGFTALHIASANGFVEIATDLLRLNPELGRLRSSDGKTALHFAAINGNVGVIRELINLCPSCKDDLTLRGETALHLAVKYGQLEAFKVMLEMFKRHNVEELLNVRNEDGNTVLHYAAAKAQFQTIRYVVESEDVKKDKLEVNAKNKNGLTAAELLDAVQHIVTDRSDYKIRELLVRDTANNNVTVAVAGTESSSAHNSNGNCTLWDYFTREIGILLNPVRYCRKLAEEVKNAPAETRNVLMIVATLIATVTYQPILNPPGGIYTDKQEFSAYIASVPIEFYVYMVPNSVGFFTSIAVIMLMIHKFPLSSLLGLAVRCMATSYICGLLLIGPTSVNSTNMTLIVVGCVVLLDIAHFFYRVTRKWYNQMTRRG